MAVGTTKKKYKIVSDGTSIGTFVFDTEGRKIGLVHSLVLSIDAADPYVKLQLLKLKVAEYPPLGTIRNLSSDIALDMEVNEEDTNIEEISMDDLKERDKG